MSLSFVAFVACNDDKENEQSGPGNVPENSSSVLSFSGKERGHSYVDLGLPSGTLWATCNVGAATPQDYGNYYAWGETTAKETYYDLESTYKYGSDYNQFTKYCYDSKYGKDGFTDNKTTLELSDDAAYMNWGGKWRMPTYDQQEELMSQCYWVWTNSYNGSNVAGYIVYKAKSSSDKGKKIYKNGTPSSSYTLSNAHIFLPAAGCYDYRNGAWALGSYGVYWSSSLHSYVPDYAWYIIFSSDDVYGNFDSRCDGLTVRAVIPRK